MDLVNEVVCVKDRGEVYLKVNGDQKKFYDVPTLINCHPEILSEDDDKRLELNLWILRARRDLLKEGVSIG